MLVLVLVLAIRHVMYRNGLFHVTGTEVDIFKFRNCSLCTEIVIINVEIPKKTSTVPKIAYQKCTTL